jgi:nitrite reductase (NADH) small subunit
MAVMTAPQLRWWWPRRRLAGPPPATDGAIDVGDAAQLRRGGRLRVTPPGFTTAVLIVHTRHGVFAVDDRCPHRGNPLSTGTVSATAITCAMHGWRFDLRSGVCQRGTGLRVRTWTVWLDHGRVWLQSIVDS